MSNRVNVVAGIIVKNNSVLLAKRPIDKHQGGLWEFPGGKVELGESNEIALERELLEELDIRISKVQYFDKIEFDYSDKNIAITFYLVLEFSGLAKGNEDQEIAWVSYTNLNNKKFPKANELIVEKLIQEFSAKNKS